MTAWLYSAWMFLRELFESLHRFESRVVLGDSLEREREQVDCRSEPLNDSVPEPSPRLVHGDKSGKLSIESETADGKNSAPLLRRQTEKLQVVVGLSAEIGNC